MKGILRKKVIFILTALAMVSTLWANGEGETAEGESGYPKVVTIGTQQVTEDIMIAIHEGLFEKYFGELGVEVQYADFSSGAEVNVALASDSIDFALSGSCPVATAASIGLDIQLIWAHAIIGDSEALIVKSDAGITTPADLAGKSVAVPVASTSHLTLLKALDMAGVTDQVTVLDMSPQDIVAAWARGDIQAAYIWNPALAQLKPDGTVLVTTADLIDAGIVAADMEVVRTKFAEKYPELVDRYVAAMIEAGNIRRESLDNASEIIADQLGLDVAVAAGMIESNIWLTPEDALSSTYFGTSEAPGNFGTVLFDTASFLKEQGAIDSVPDLDYFNNVVQSKYIENAMELVK
jgi:taurine transport system substrate-binding protein